MGTMPIGRLLLTMALPMALSMLVQALYNVVDSAFVAKISDVNQDALNAVSLAFPVQNIMIGIATGTAVGVNALLSRALGERNADMVNRSALNGVFLAGLGMLLSALFGIFCAELFMRSQTSNEAVIAYGTAYIRIITIASFGIFGEIIFERLLQSTGRTIYTLFTQGTGAVLNIIFDPILIFGLFGLPRMEVAGAAVATVLGQIVAFIPGHDPQPPQKSGRPPASARLPPGLEAHRPHSGHRRAVHDHGRHRLGDVLRYEPRAHAL